MAQTNYEATTLPTSINWDPEFHRLLIRWVECSFNGGDTSAALADLIVHIDARVAHQRQAAAHAPARSALPDLLPPLGIHNDRDMLNYLMGAFDNEISNCERCGHADPTKYMDSAGFLREYLAAASAAPAVEPMPDWLAYDASTGTLTIHGIKYTVNLFLDFASVLPLGELFSIVRRSDGVLTVERAEPAPAGTEPTQATLGELADDAKRLDFLDTNVHKFRMGWEISTAPIGNLSVRVILMGGQPIREAIDQARAAAKGAGGQS